MIRVFLFFFLVAPAYAQKASLILKNASIYSMVENAEVSEAIAIDGNKILFVGNLEAVEKFKGPQTKVKDLNGAMVLPGFHDAHIHPVTSGVEISKCNVSQAKTVEELKEIILKYAETHPNEKWIVGGGWSLSLFPNANPSREILDELISDRPIALTSFDSHSYWVNSKALEIAKITKETKDPSDGRIERDKNGNPSGTLREGAMNLVYEHLPVPTMEENLAGLRTALKMGHKFGITSMFDPSVSDEIIKTYSSMEDMNELRTRMVLAYDVELDENKNNIKTILNRKNKLKKSKWINLTAGKIFADGVVEAKTAAVLVPYLDTNNKGVLNASAKVIKDKIKELDAENLDAHIHAIGDRAVRISLDGIEAAQNANPKWDSRHTLVHLELIDPKDIPRFKSLDVIANFQSYWAQPDALMMDLTLPVLDKKIHRWIYPIKSVFDTSATVVGGSDWSVTTMNPLDAIEVGITRKGPGKGGKSLIAEEKMELFNMLKMYTVNAAYQMRQEDKVGTLAPGKEADLVVLEKDLFKIRSSEIHTVPVVLTMVAGEIVYER